jgi:hypothetical protein
MSDRYEPLPGFTEMPAWLWRRAGRGVRIGAGVFVLAAIGVTAAVAPAIDESKDERAATERRERAAQHAALIRRLNAEQRPVFGRSRSVAVAGAPPGRQLEARADALADLSAAILADARARVRRGKLDGPIRRVACSPFPRSVDGVRPEEDLSRARGRYGCIAVTADFGGTSESVGGALGHPYRAVLRFGSGRYAFCKIWGRPDPTTLRKVLVPKACGGP